MPIYVNFNCPVAVLRQFWHCGIEMSESSNSWESWKLEAIEVQSDIKIKSYRSFSYPWYLVKFIESLLELSGDQFFKGIHPTTLLPIPPCHLHACRALVWNKSTQCEQDCSLKVTHDLSKPDVAPMYTDINAFFRKSRSSFTVWVLFALLDVLTKDYPDQG